MGKAIDFGSSHLFDKYSIGLLEDIKLLRKVILPNPLVFNINWEMLETASMVNTRNRWSSIPIFKELSKHSQNPAVYYFITDESYCEAIHSKYISLAGEKSKIRLMNGVKAEGYVNLSHIPLHFRSTECLYAGSVQDKLQQRLLQHLGYSSGRTGALYLKQALRGLDKAPSITFYAHILQPEWRRIRAHIECVIQDHLQPLLGKRAFRDEGDFKS